MVETRLRITATIPFFLHYRATINEIQRLFIQTISKDSIARRCYLSQL